MESSGFVEMIARLTSYRPPRSEAEITLNLLIETARTIAPKGEAESDMERARR